MGIKYIHVFLIILSIALFLIFGIWTLKHDNALTGYASFVIAAGLAVYCLIFIKKMKDL